jgi:hypothetical protein
VTPRESPMSRLACRAVTLALGLAAFCATGAAQESGIPAKLHPWGRFEPGTWKTVRVVTETLNEQGRVVSTSTTDTKTTLLNVCNDGVTLEVEACMEVAGKRFEVEPQIVKEGFHGEMAGSTVTLKEPVDGEIKVEDQKIPCKIRQLSLVGPNGKANLTLHYSTTVPPYVLKRECVITDTEGKNTGSETNKDLIALDMPVRVLGQLRGGSYVRAVHKNGKTTVTTLSVVVCDVPGGVVSHSSKEVDKNGRLLRRSTLALVDYNADPDKDRGLFGRKRPNRRTKPPTRYGP